MAQRRVGQVGPGIRQSGRGSTFTLGIGALAMAQLQTRAAREVWRNQLELRKKRDFRRNVSTAWSSKPRQMR